MIKFWCILTILAVVVGCQGWAQADSTDSDEPAVPSARVAGDSAIQDVNQDPNRSEIVQVVGKRVMQCYPDGTFRPYATVTEEAFGKVLDRFMVACPTTYDAGFEVKSASLEMSRVRALTIILRYCANADLIQSTLDPQGKLSRFIDGSSVPGWALKYTAFAVEQGFIKGGQALHPLEPLTRSDLAGFISRAMAWSNANPNSAAPVAAKKPVIYTSLVIDCRGLDISRSMCPEIRTEEGDKIYPDMKNAPSIDFVESQGLVAYARELSDSKRTGGNPLIIRAIDVVGTASQAAVITEEDRELIAAEEKNSKFLSKWNVVFLKD